MELIYKTEMKHCIDTLMQRGGLTGRSVFLFGHCNATEETIDCLIENGIVVEAILDNSKSKQGTRYRDIPVTPPSLMVDWSASNSIVIISTRFFEEMAEQLRQLGYEGEIVQAVEYNSFAEYSLSIETISRKKSRMERGEARLAKIRRQYPLQHLVVCPNNALGDVYWAMAFLPAYCTKHGIQELAIVLVGSGCRQVAEIFGMAHIIALNQAEMDELVQALIFSCESNCIIAHHDRPYTDNIIQWLNHHFLSFIDYYRCAVYGLPRNTPPVRPLKLHRFTDMKRLTQGNTVIIAPHAKSVVEPIAVFWEQLSAQYQRDGYLVCTNVNVDEPPVAGTIPLHIPLNQMASAAEYAGHFVGLRSGLCDLVHSANCRKMVVFPDCFYSTTPHKVADFFALPGWEKMVI